MRVQHTALAGVRIVEPDVFGDERGAFLESWQRDRYAAAGIADDFRQDNVSVSRGGVLRGLHLQAPGHEQAKLVSVAVGAIYDVAVDVRRGSPSFGRWVGCMLSAENRSQLYVPVGFAHGFVVVGGEATVIYKVTGAREPASEVIIAWDDPTLAIAWPVRDPVLSERDRSAPRLSDVPRERLPTYAGGDAAP